MRTLTRPMFNMGGPIKQGIMHGIREPKKHGGKMLLVGQHPKEFQDKSGREKHLAPVVVGGLAAASRFLPAAWRGFKAARYWKPGTLGKWGRLKSLMAPTKGIGAPMAPSGAGAGFRVGSWAKQNPAMALTALTLPNVAGTGIYQHGPGAAKGAWGLTKRYADAVIPGDQSRWWKDPEPPKGVPLNPNLQKNLQKEAPVIDPEAAEAAALAKRQKELNERIKKYRDIMDIKGMNKQAAYKSLVDASKLIQESGDFKGDIKSGKLINQVIQAASKQFDKPAQASKAVDTLILQNELKKDLEAETKEQDKRYKESAIAVNEAKLAENTLAGDIRKYTSQTQALPTGSTLAGLATGRGYPIKGVEDVTIVKKWMKNNEGKNEVDYFQSIVTDAEVAPGLYVINDKILAVDENKKVTPVPLA